MARDFWILIVEQRLQRLRPSPASSPSARSASESAPTNHNP